MCERISAVNTSRKNPWNSLIFPLEESRTVPHSQDNYKMEPRNKLVCEEQFPGKILFC